MVRDSVMRRTLWVTAVLNLGVALLMAWPASAPAQLAGLPAPVPALYRLLLAYLIALFGLAYVWLARRPRMDRPLVTVAAAGKAGVAVIAVACWVAGAASGRIALLISGDLVFAAIFAWWLLSGGGDEERAGELARRS